MELSLSQRRELDEALRNAFTDFTLRRMLSNRLDKRLDQISVGRNLSEIVFEIIENAEREGWIEELIRGAYLANRDNPKLSRFASEMGLVPSQPDSDSLSRMLLNFALQTDLQDSSDNEIFDFLVGSFSEVLGLRPSKKVSYGDTLNPETNEHGFERLIERNESYLNIGPFIRKLTSIRKQVGRIEIDDQAIIGTGFLIGPSTIITPYHVVEDFIDGRRNWKRALIRFDFSVSDDNVYLNDGHRFLFASDWLVDFSPYSPTDLHPLPKKSEPTLEELDYAIIRLSEQPGNEVLEGELSMTRGWIPFPQTEPNLSIDSPMHIAHHPSGEPLKISLGQQSIIETNVNMSRVRYRTQAEPGSTGAPCFDQSWNLVAMHHAGDPGFGNRYSEGIPIWKIIELLRQRGFEDLITENMAIEDT
ncbi:MAG: effector-associated domain EAD1-containing protein [Chloroflexota bacterium]